MGICAFLRTQAPGEALLFALAPAGCRLCELRSYLGDAPARARAYQPLLCREHLPNKHPNVFLGCTSGMRPGSRRLSASLPRAATFQTNPVFPQDKCFPLEREKGLFFTDFGGRDERMGVPGSPGPGCRRQVAAEPSRGCAPLPGLPSPPEIPDPGAPPLPGSSWNEPAAAFPSKPICLAGRGTSLLPVPCPGSFPSRKGEARRQIQAGSALLPILNQPKASTVTFAGPCWAQPHFKHSSACTILGCHPSWKG